MAIVRPDPGIYFRKGHFDDRLIDGLLTVKITVAIFTPFGVEEKELTFTGTDLMTIVQQIVTTVANLGVGRGLAVSRSLGGTLAPISEQRAREVQPSALAEPGA